VPDSDLTKGEPDRDLRDLAEEHADEEEREGLFEELSWLAEQPLDLNLATEADLLRIPGVTRADAGTLLALRRRLGSFTSAEQFMRQGADVRRMFFLISPFVRLGTPRTALVRTRSRWLWKIEPAGNNAASAKLGPPTRELQRFDARVFDGIRIGGHLCRDPGEPYRYAFLSGYARFSGLPWIDDLIIGDVRTTAALGIVLGTSALSSGAGMTAGRNGADFRMEPYYGSTEWASLRGVAASRVMRFRSGTISVMGVFSRTQVSGSLDSLGNIISIDKEAVFADEGDMRRRHVATDLTGAVRGVYTSRGGITLGVTALRTACSRSRISEDPYPRPGSYQVLGVDGRFDGDAISVATECALTQNGAALAGRVGVDLVQRFMLECLAWYYGPGYWNERSGGIGNGGEIRNDAGVKLSWQGRISETASISGHLRHYRRPWRTFYDPVPPSGKELAFGLTLRIAPGVSMDARLTSGWKEHVKSADLRNGMPDVDMAATSREHLRCCLDIGLGTVAGFRSRVDLCQVRMPDAGGEKGWMFVQEATLRSKESTRISVRAALFRTDSYASRLYAQERDVEGTYTNPPCYGTGMRWYVLVCQPILGAMVISGKYSSSSSLAGAFLQPSDHAISLQIDFRTDTD
jgi:hypothetical protein